MYYFARKELWRIMDQLEEMKDSLEFIQNIEGTDDLSGAQDALKEAFNCISAFCER